MAKKERNELADRVRKLRTELGLTQTEFGVQIGIDQSNVSKWERGEDRPSSHFAFKMAEMAGLPATWFLGLPGAKQDQEPGTKSVRLVGEVQAGAWKEAIEWAFADQLEIPHPPGLSSNIPSRAFRVVGSSTNRIYPDRSTVYIAPVSHRHLTSGHKVLVTRRSSEGLYEATIKEYVVHQDGSKWLWPRSHDPRHQTPLPFRDKTPEDVSIMGIVAAATILEDLP